MSGRLTFLVVFGSAATVFLAQTLGYRGYEYMTFVSVLSFAGAIGIVASALMTAKLIDLSGIVNAVFAISSLVGLPLLVDYLVPANVHGPAFLGFIVYFYGSEAAGIGLLIALVVRIFTRHRLRR